MTETTKVAVLTGSDLHLVLCLLDARAMKDDATAAECGDLARRLRDSSGSA